MGTRVYKTVQRPSVCLSHRSTAAAACVGFAAERPSPCRQEISIDSAVQQAPMLNSKFGQCHVYSRRKRLNTGLLTVVWVTKFRIYLLTADIK